MKLQLSGVFAALVTPIDDLGRPVAELDIQGVEDHAPDVMLILVAFQQWVREQITANWGQATSE